MGLAVRLTVIAISVALLVWAAARRGAGDVTMAYVHAGIAATTALGLAILGILATRAAIAAGASRSAVGASKAREMGLVWAWAALAILATYGTAAATWKEWLHFFAPFALVAAGCLWFSRTLARDAARGVDDVALLKLSRYMAFGQLGGMVVTMIGLVVDGKMVRYLAPRKGWEDWPANNYFFFGALALAILSLHAIRAQSRLALRPGPASAT
jgi:hypothetical protein